MECDKKTKKGIKYLSPEFIDSDDSDDDETPTPTPTNKKKRGRPSEDIKPEAKKQKISTTTIKTKKRKSTSSSAEKLNTPPPAAAVTTTSDVDSTSTIPTVQSEKGSNSNADTTNKKSNSSEERFKAFNVINVTRLIKLQYLTNIKLLSSKDRSTYLNQEMRTNVVLVPEENPLNAPLKKLKSVAMSSIDYNYVTVRYPAKNKFNKF
ncbi:hypothetical protein PmNV_040 [Penaeus monodon nudivirus]|uniref:Uncharacterized protein n=1 Tax=Penaeus monodon nudivirus TaxID=1529056 RepID=A0A076FD14_9VIRU|nr:hypothetical protein PmNV_040 [Penaeus monodon nudivirus]AII15828.1 hypothetical protein PmNV_040 [Penaeus monodon nudivirus]